MTYDFIIFGGGIVGLSTAWQLQQRYPDKRMLLLEKETQLAAHQSGHNSGVIHAGVYYQPGSLKARFCREGVAATLDFCQQNDIPFQQCGKLLVATSEIEQQRMQALFQRCRDNQIEVELLDQAQLREHEPHISGLGTIRVKATGIVDYRQVCAAMSRRFQDLGGEVRLGVEVTDIEELPQGIVLQTDAGEFKGRFLAACAGLMADRVAAMLGIAVDFRIIPFRGEYYRLPPHKNGIIKHLIYPIPDPGLPFLGVHLTRMIDGSVTVGPNAVLGWKREGYGAFNFNLEDACSTLGYSGFWKLAATHAQSGLAEMKNSLWKPGYLRQVQKYCPGLEISDLHPHPAGVRAQAVLRDGTLVHDFLFLESRHSLHVGNAPSPAATSAIPIGRHICDRIVEKLG